MSYTLSILILCYSLLVSSSANPFSSQIAFLMFLCHICLDTVWLWLPISLYLFKSTFCRGGKTYNICLSESGLFCILLNIRTSNSIYFWLNETTCLNLLICIGPLGWFLNLAVVNSAPGNTGKPGVCKLAGLASFGYIPRAARSGSHGSSCFRFLRFLHIDVHNGWTSLQSHLKCV